MDMLFRYFKPLKSKRGNRIQRQDHRSRTLYDGCSNWQAPPHDVMELILRRLSLNDRIRLSIVNKHWGSFSTRRDIYTAPQMPWLVHRSPNCKNNYLSFFSCPSEDKVRKLSLPKPLERSYFYGSSKGWLIMITNRGLNPRVFLVNPISGTKFQLPSLRSVPSFQKFLKTKGRKLLGACVFYCDVVLSTSDISSEYCTAAAVFDSFRIVGLCRPGDETWSVFHLLDEDEWINDILFSSGKLYVLVGGSLDKNGIVATHTLKFGDDHVIDLKLIYDKKENMSPIRIEHEDHHQIISKGHFSSSSLVESNSEVLVIHQIQDLLLNNLERKFGPIDFDIDDIDFDIDNDDEEDINDDDDDDDTDEGDDVDRDDHYHNNNNDDEEPASYEPHLRTCDFRVYKLDSKNDNLGRLKGLGDQLLFLADCGSFSLPASDFKEVEGNCIYFAMYESCEIGVFYPDGGRIERFFPSVEVSKIRSLLSWFTPSLG